MLPSLNQQASSMNMYVPRPLSLLLRQHMGCTTELRKIKYNTYIGPRKQLYPKSVLASMRRPRCHAAHASSSSTSNVSKGGPFLTYQMQHPMHSVAALCCLPSNRAFEMCSDGPWALGLSAVAV